MLTTYYSLKLTPAVLLILFKIFLISLNKENMELKEEFEKVESEIRQKIAKL